MPKTQETTGDSVPVAPVLKFGVTTYRLKAKDSRAVGGTTASAIFGAPEDALALAEEWKAAGHYKLIRIEASREALCFPEEE